MTQPISAHLRWSNRGDCDAMLLIDQASFPQPWTAGDFLDVVKDPKLTSMVAEFGPYHPGTVAGYVVFEPLKSSMAILRLAVHPDWRRRCIGVQLVSKVAERVVSTGRKRISLGLRERNLDGQLFLKACGFRATLVRRGHYRDTGEDAFMFEYRPKILERKAA